MRRAWMPTIASFAALLLPTTTHAAFAPRLSVELNPPVAGEVPEVVARVGQAPAEPAVRRLTLRFPPGFIVNRALTVPRCAASDVATRSCPEISRIGHIETPLGDGALYLTDLGRHAAALAGDLNGRAIRGAFRPALGDSLDVSLDGLPTIALASLTIVLDGGDRGLVRTPSDCGTWFVSGNFTSWLGDFPLAQAPLGVSQCLSAPVTISRLRLTRRAFRAGTGTRLSWTLSRATAGTRVYVERRQGADWQRAGSLIAAGDAGVNTLIFDGRIRGRALRPGSYRFLVMPRGGSAGAAAGFTVVPGPARPR